jgi:predicted permease
MRDTASLVRRVVTALAAAVGVWFAVMLAAATVGRLVLELAEWVGVLLVAVVGNSIQVPLSVVPHVLAIAAWPASHLDRFAWYAVGSTDGIDLVPRVLGLTGTAVLFFVLVRRGPRNVR